ncbi:hypothetical protein EDB19DRAFT_1837675 [Suillus lakei]|nr:hypothetical protein EDB19DRAFT_1837675 [Suillus lakei]
MSSTCGFVWSHAKTWSRAVRLVLACVSEVMSKWSWAVQLVSAHVSEVLTNTPLDVIQPHILRLWKAHQMDREIVMELQKHLDTVHYGLSVLSLMKFLKIHEGMGLQRVRQQNHNVESIHGAMTNLRLMYPNAGAREVECRRILFLYGLGLHTGIEPFSGRIMWMRVWHSNRNPQFILSHYLDTVEMLGPLIYLLDMPMVTQSDPGSENYGIAKAHTMLRQWHDPALQGSLQHRWMRTKKNVMPEITWSQMQHHFTPGFETLLDHGVTSGWMLFCWVFIPWLQWELDAYQDRILPHGAPNIIYQSPENFGVLDFKIKVEHEALDHVRDLYIDPSHIVFDLVPRPFSKFMEHCYTELGCPVVTRQTVWDVYLCLLAIVQASKEMIPHHIELYDEPEEDLIALPLLENYQDLPDHEDGNGGYYMGGVGGGLGLVGEHLHRLESLAQDDEPNVTLGINENAVGLDHAGLVVWEFSDGDDLDDNDSDIPDKW